MLHRASGFDASDFKAFLVRFTFREEPIMSDKIADGKVVDLSYELTNEKGEVLDKSTAKDPFTYLHGAQQIVEGLETALLGLKVGDRKKVSVPPALGYGEHNPELKLVVNRSQFPAEAEIEQGMRFRANSLPKVTTWFLSSTKLRATKCTSMATMSWPDKL